jgi:hypothetical protein
MFREPAASGKTECGALVVRCNELFARSVQLVKLAA